MAARDRIAKPHQYMANTQKDFLHKLTTEQTKTYCLILIEDLMVGNMSRSASGTLEEPGENVKQKAGLNKAILDQGWSEYRRQLEYKMCWAGGKVIAVHAMNNSLTCPCCTRISKLNRKTQSRFACIECGLAENADYVAAVNIWKRGLKMIEGQDMTEASVRSVSSAWIACEVNGEAMPSATGINLIGPAVTRCQHRPARISFLPARAAALAEGGEDVNWTI